MYGADEVDLEPEDKQVAAASFPQDTTKTVSQNNGTNPPSTNPSNKSSSEFPKKGIATSLPSLASTNGPTAGSAITKQSESAASLSYSAQIAKQFSAYQQTPSQERQQRQQRSSISLGPTTPISPSDSAPSAIASYESRTENDKPFIPQERPIRPSEMKDEG